MSLIPTKAKLCIRYFKEGMLDLVFPRQDLWTGDPMDEVDGEGKGLYLSKDSRRYLNVIQEPFCLVCGFPLYGKTVGSMGCHQCEHLAANFESSQSVVLLNRLGRKMIHELKYHHGLYLSSDLELIVRDCSRIRERIEGHVLVPVPLHPKKCRERGYNQSVVLAEVFRKVWGDHRTEIAELLVRDKDTESQTLMDRKTRIKNMKNAFLLNAEVAMPRDRAVTIVDDVFTTGSTINACAAVLRKEGFQTIQSLTFGHG